MRPTVITNVSDDSRLMQEEIFGPVTCILPFKTEEEVGGSEREKKYRIGHAMDGFQCQLSGPTTLRETGFLYFLVLIVRT